jgi:16S rRNA (cytosine967-C5)-methyltransferase
MRFPAHFDTAASLVKGYNGEEPLAHYLKRYYARHKKHGSLDRKIISHICYCFFRLGHSLRDLNLEERMRVGLLLCSDDLWEWDGLLESSGAKLDKPSLEERLEWVAKAYPGFSLLDIFPWAEELSDQVDQTAYCQSFLRQPELFLRVRPGQGTVVRHKLTKAQLAFRELSPDCLALDNASRVDRLLKLDREAVVQDQSSQEVGTFIRHFQQYGERSVKAKVWDCCSGSGGKSLLAVDILEQPQLTVSDRRASILRNLRKRFSQAGIRRYKSFTADLSSQEPLNLASKVSFDLIIADVPCSGSGTWARTPEELYFFRPVRIAFHAARQQAILSHLHSRLAPGGQLIYITCSVFNKENEEMTRYVESGLGLIRKESGYLAGWGRRSDTLFAARFSCDRPY